MRLPQQLTTIAATACCLALTTTGCDGEPAPKPTSSPSASNPTESKAAPMPSRSSDLNGKTWQSTTPSIGEKAEKPVREDFRHINEKTEKGAAATLEYFVEAYRYSLLTGDPSALKAVSASECGPCQKLIQRAYDENVQFTTADWELSNVGVTVKSADRIDTVVRAKSRTVGAKRGTVANQTFLIGASMEWIEGRWKATDSAMEIEGD